MERRIRQRLELQSTHAQQMHFKNLRRKAEEDEEEEFRQQVKGHNSWDIVITAVVIRGKGGRGESNSFVTLIRGAFCNFSYEENNSGPWAIKVRQAYF